MGGLKYNFEESSSVLSQSALQLKLSILIGMDSFDYIVSDESERLLAFKSYSLDQSVSGNSYSEFEDFFRQDPLLNRTYGFCRISAFSPYFTLVPTKLFKEKEEELYLEQAAELGQKYHSVAEPILPEGQVNVFAHHAFLEDWCSSRFKGYRKSHPVSAMIRYAMRMQVPGITGLDRLFLYRTGDHFIFLLVKEGHLHFVNIFTIHHKNQLVYYLGLIFNQFNLRQLDTHLFILGGFLQKDPFLEDLEHYVGQVAFAELPKRFVLGETMIKAPLYALFLPTLGLLE